MQRNEFYFANKPGVLPGKPISLDGGINALKQTARIESRQEGFKLNCRKLTTTGATLVIGACEQHAAGRFTQDGRTVVFKMGGAY